MGKLKGIPFTLPLMNILSPKTDNLLFTHCLLNLVDVIVKIIDEGEVDRKKLVVVVMTGKVVVVMTGKVVVVMTALLFCGAKLFITIGTPLAAGKLRLGNPTPTINEVVENDAVTLA